MRLRSACHRTAASSPTESATWSATRAGRVIA
jgi:5-methylcytosine-specific restriction endonuclease McrA